MKLLSALLGTPQAFAVDLSDTTLQIMEVRGGGTGRVGAFTHQDIPPGLIENGRILDQAKLAEAIRAGMNSCKPGPPSTKRAAAELPDTQTFLHHIRCEETRTHTEMREHIRTIAEEHVPLNLEESYWDFKITEQSAEGMEILFAAAPKAIIEIYVHTFTLAGLELVLLEPESIALARGVVERVKIPAGSIQAIIDIGGRSTTMVFVERTGVRLSVSVPAAGQAFTAAIAEAKHLDSETAEQVKREQGFSDGVVAEAVRKALSPVLEEFAKAHEFACRTSGCSLGGIILAGGSSAMPGLAEELKTQFGCEITMAKVPFTVGGLQLHQIATISGLAVRAKKLSPGINFIQKT
ncbi:pilus assembly protein PilM [Candidatus Uhrbacteria bacterium]|nr:pilus assembly protein PilM [Candidatus Uhrbacteria bacterium]